MLRPWLSSLPHHPLDQQVDDLGDLFLGQLVEHDDLVDAVQELGPEAALQVLVHLLLHLLVRDGLVGLAETRPQALRRSAVPRLDVMMITVFLEVDRAPLGASVETTVLQDLEERVEHVGVRLLDLVEEHDRERLAPHGFR